MVFLRRFNTSHVTLYRCDRGFHFCTKASFQYISCYSLSSSGVTVTSSSTCFNTSHVTLYLEVHDKQKHCRSFNTSHVTLYRCPNRTHSGHYGRFNTSHVTLYPMERRIAETVNKFQYISCYSLSQSLQFLRLDPVVSIHLMLLFILDMTVLLFRSLFVSIHLMLLFIPRFIGFSSSNSFYNTAKYKGLQDFYQSTSHFLFTQSKPGIPPYFQYFSFFYENPPGNFYNFSFNLLKEFPCHVFTLTGEFFYYKIKSSPLSFFPFPGV